MAGKLIYVFTPIKSLDQLFSLPKTLDKDAAFKPHPERIISMRTTKLRLTRDLNRSYYRLSQNAGCSRSPKLDGPKSESIYELRSYEGIPKKFTRIR
jgi:hypothetical protein